MKSVLTWAITSPIKMASGGPRVRTRRGLPDLGTAQNKQGDGSPFETIILHIAIYCSNLYMEKAISMSKTTSIYAWVEPENKEQAEVVLNKLGIPMSNAINIFPRQIVLQNGLLLRLKLPQKGQ